MGSSFRRTGAFASIVAATAVAFEKVGRVGTLEIVALFVYVTLLLVVDWLTAADKTEVLCLTDNRLVTKVSSLEGFGEVATWTICNCIVFDFLEREGKNKEIAYNSMHCTLFFI